MLKIITYRTVNESQSLPLFASLGIHSESVSHGDQIVELQIIVIVQHLIECRVDSSDSCMRAEMEVETKIN